jgi:hypothetical protein
VDLLSMALGAKLRVMGRAAATTDFHIFVLLKRNVRRKISPAVR